MACKMPLFLGLEEKELQRFCCLDCVSEENQLSDTDFEQCMVLIRDAARCAFEERDGLSRLDADRAVRGRLYEYLVHAGYSKYCKLHPLPLFLDMYMSQAIRYGQEAACITAGQTQLSISTYIYSG